jgi:hypothetical protein
VPEILRVAVVALVELVSSDELLRMALVELERIFQEDAYLKEGVEGAEGGQVLDELLPRPCRWRTAGRTAGKTTRRPIFRN